MSLFKLTPDLKSKPKLIVESRLYKEIKDAIPTLVDLSRLQTFKIMQFYATGDDTYVQYALVSLVIPFDKHIDREKYYDVFDQLLYLGTNNVSLKLTDYPINWFINGAQFNFSIYNGMASVYVTESNDYVRELETRYRDDEVIDYCSEQSILIINKLNACPFIRVSEDEFSINIENDFLLLDLPGTTNHTKKFSKWEYEIINKSIYICLDDFEEIYHKMPESVFEVATSKELHPKNILSLVCVCVSIVCLIITISIYGFFSVLKSQPGVNNLILAVLLLLAQSVYQFGAGQNTISKWACALIGGISHFLWLAVMFAMNVCCIQMLVSFRKQILITNRYKMRQTVKNILYIICASVLFTCLNIVDSLVVSDGRSSGYGGELCYISSFTMQLITFVLPSAIALLANFVMFAYVVYEIRKTVQSTHILNKEKNYLRVYVRLSALTGLTWVVGFLQLALKLQWLEYIFIISNASQGVYIMLAFVINKRVMSLICNKLKDSSTLT